MTDLVIADCFACGRHYSRGGRFCSKLCRSAFDAGYPATSGQTAPWRTLDGKRYRVWGTITDKDLHLATVNLHEIECRGCRGTFISKGLRCCSPDCERKFREREDIAAVMADAGMERSTKRKCEVCPNTIPKWLPGGKLVPSSRRFCSPKCRQKAWMLAKAKDAA